MAGLGDLAGVGGALRGVLGGHQHYRDHADDYPAEVRAVSGASEFVLFATPEEVGRINGQFAAILEPFKARFDPARRPESGADTPPQGAGESAQSVLACSPWLSSVAP